MDAQSSSRQLPTSLSERHAHDDDHDHGRTDFADELAPASISSSGRRPAHLRPARRARTAAAHDPSGPLRNDYSVGGGSGRRGRSVKNAVGGGMVASMKRGMKGRRRRGWLAVYRTWILAAIALVLLAFLNYAWFARTHKHVQAVGGWKAVLARPFTSTFSSDTGTPAAGHKLIDIDIPPQVRRPDHYHPGVQRDEM